MSIPDLSQAEAMILQSLSTLENQVAELSSQLGEMKDISQCFFLLFDLKSLEKNGLTTFFFK